MKPLALFASLFLCAPVSAQIQPNRPPIVGIGSVRIALSNPTSFVKFYINALGFGAGLTVCNGASKTCIEVNKNQRIDLNTPHGPVGGTAMLMEVDFETTDVVQLRSYLIAHGMHPTKVLKTEGSNLYFVIPDPEGHQVGFIQYLKQDKYSHPENQISAHLIHAGFVVHDRAAEDHFYKDILGFRLYWHGGFKDDGEDWYELQVPDGTDWIEYMLNIPADADRKELGIQNHFSLGVKDIHAAAEQLRKNGLDKFDGPEIGRDGKWALDAYDPDGTRVEIMEFTPAKEPCCHPYTAPHPKP